MSLINDMLRDLDARKRAQAGDTHATEPAPPTHAVPHVPDARHGDGGRGSDERVQHRLRWMLPAYLGALIILAFGLYLAFAGRGGVLERDGLARAMRSPAPVAVVEPVAAAPAETAPEPSRLILLALEQGDAGTMRLVLRFAPALRAPLRVGAAGGRVRISADRVDSGAVESPSPLLRDWRSEADEAGWRASFAWDGSAEIELQPVLDKDTSQGWVLRLSPPSAQSAGTSAAPPVAAAPVATVKPATPAPAPSPRAAEPSTVAADDTGRNIQTLYADAWRLQQDGQTAPAIERLTRLLDLDPGDERGRELLARLYLRQGDRPQAVAVLRAGLDRIPGQARWLDLLARVLDGGGMRAQAIDLLRQQGGESVLEHQALLGALAAQSGQWEVAAVAYRRALALAPRQARWWLGLGLALDKQGDTLGAHAAYQGALDAGGLSPDNVSFVQKRMAALKAQATP